MIKKITVEVELSKPTEVSPGTGIYETKLTHPLLRGSLSFVHLTAAARDQFVKSLDSSIAGEISKVLSILGGIEHGTINSQERTEGGVGEVGLR